MRRKAGGLVALVLAACALGLALVSARPTTLFRGEGLFGEVRVVEHRSGLRSLYVGEGRARQTTLDPERPLHLELPYTRVAMAGLALVPADARLLFVGLGGGAMPTYVRAVRRQATIDVVEIDPLVAGVAVRYFGFRPDSLLSVHVDDGRAFIERAPPASWHAVFLDAFSDDAIPQTLATREFLEATRLALAPGGVVVSNLWTTVDEYPSMVATYEAVFDQVALLRVPSRRQVILLAGDRAGVLERDALLRAVRSLAASAALGFDLEALVRTGHTRTLPADGSVLSDPDPEAYPQVLRPTAFDHPRPMNRDR